MFRKTFRAKNEIRTRDPNLGKVVLYQLSYFRLLLRNKLLPLFLVSTNIECFKKTAKLFSAFFHD